MYGGKLKFFAAALIAGLCTGVSAQQFILVDGVFDYNDDGHIGDMAPHKQAPANWIRPVNYRDGVAHIRIEVLNKANDTTPTSVLCRVGSGEHAERAKVIRIGFQKTLFKKPGLCSFEQDVCDAEPLIKPGTFDWDKRPTLLQIVVTDPNGQMVSKWEHDLGTFTGEMKDYFPLKIHYTVIVTAKDAVFEKPGWWDNPSEKKS
jgi:hypothetical protein